MVQLVTELRDASPLEPVILLSGGEATHPKTPGQEQLAVQAWSEFNVGTILNVSTGETATVEHLKLYSDAGIYYEQVPIDDTTIALPRDDFAPKVLAAYDRHIGRNGAAKSFLINCSAGINRSGLAAAIVLWNRTNPRPWLSCDSMLREMRVRQLRDREMPFLLTNSTFLFFLAKLCRFEGTTSEYGRTRSRLQAILNQQQQQQQHQSLPQV